MKEVLGPVAELMCQVRPVKYSEILEFDRKIRDFNAKAVPDEFVRDSSAIFFQTSLKIYRESGRQALYTSVC